MSTAQPVNHKWSWNLMLLFILVLPTVGQFTLPFLYMPIKRLLRTQMQSRPQDEKVTGEDVRVINNWSLATTYSKNMISIFKGLPIEFFHGEITADKLLNLDHQWSYVIPFEDLNSSFSAESVAKKLTPAEFQHELLRFTSEKFLFSVNGVASRLGIPAVNLSRSYDPGDWATVVHAMIMESTLAFSNKLQLPSVDALANLVQIGTQELLNLNLSTFEGFVFPFPPKKAILDANTTSTIFNSSGISEALYPESALSEALRHEKIVLSPQQFGILYNMSEEQVETLDRSTLKQIYHMCMIRIEDILNKTLPDASRNVFGSFDHPSPCPVLIKIKGNSISSLQTNPVIISEQMTVLRILTSVAYLSWHVVRWSVDASLSDWEILDAVTLPRLGEISGHGVESLQNDSVSESVKLVFALRDNGTLDNITESYRAFTTGVLIETFNLTLNEVATLTRMADGSLINVSSAFLFQTFFNATVVYFKLNSSEVIKALQMTEEELYYLPRQEWNDTIPVIIDAVVKIEATKLQMSVANLFQLIGYNSNGLSISQLKKLIGTRFQEVKEKKTKFESDPLSWYLANNSIPDADYLNTSIHALLLSGSGFTDAELKLIYDLKPDERFILEGLRFSDLPRVCQFDTSATKEKTLHNITKELVGIRESPALCETSRFYVDSRQGSMSYLQTAFTIIENSTVSFVNLVEMVTRLPWRENVWAFGLKMEDWTALYVLNQETFRNVTGSSLNEFLSKTLLEVFQECLQLQTDNNTDFRMRESQSKGPALDILYELFNTNEGELIRFGSMTEEDFDELSPFAVVPLAYKYLEAKFSVSLETLEASLNLPPGNLNKLAPTEWKEVIPFVKAEVIRSGRQRLHVSLLNFAKLQQETVKSLQNLTLAQLESKWDNTLTRLMNGKMAMENESLLHIMTSVGLSKESTEKLTVLNFIENRINFTKSELFLLYNFSSITTEALGNYTFKEVSQYCQITEDNLYNKRLHDIVVSLLGHINDMKCPKVASLIAAATTTVDELVAKSNFNVHDDVSLLMMFEDQFQLPWPKIAWAVNASLPDWPVLGATSLSNISTLLSKTTETLKRQKSFREITSQLLALSPISYGKLVHDYRARLVSKVSSLFNVNSTKLCENCSIINLLWNSLTQLSFKTDFDLHNLPHELKVSPYEFNLTLPSQWSLIVFPIVKGAYARAAQSLEMSPDRLSTLLDIQPSTLENMTVKEFHDLLEQSIQPLISARTVLTESSLINLVTAVGKNFSALKNDSLFDLIDSLINIPIQNLTFIFNWTAEQQAILKNYTLDDMIYYRGVEVGNETLLSLASFVLRENLSPRTPAPPTLPPCKRGLTREGNNAKCTDVHECGSGKCGEDSQCHDYYGGFDCECKVPGHFKARFNETCKPCKTFRGTMTITNEVFGSSLKNKTTGDFFDFKEEFETTVNQEFKKTSLKQFYYGCRVNNFRSGSVIVDFLIFTSPEFSGSLQNLQNALTSRLNNSHLGTLKVKNPEIEDFDECADHRDDCGQHASCVNTEGSFDCKCNDGYDGDGRKCEAGFFKTMWWTVIVAAFLLLIVVIIVVCLVVKRPKPSGRYGLETDDSLSKKPDRRKSKITYRNGDVYYKDKEGKLRQGTAHSSTSQESGRSCPPHYVDDEEDDNKNFEPSGRVRAKTPFEVAVERNSRNGNIYEQRNELQLSELPSNGANGGAPSSVEN